MPNQLQTSIPSHTAHIPRVGCRKSWIITEFRLHTIESYCVVILGLMRGVNPVIVPRNWVLERAEHAAEAGDYEEVRCIHSIFCH